MKFRKFAFASLRPTLLTGAAFVISYSGAQAAGIWDGGGEATPTTPGNYDTAANWDNDVVPGTINVSISNNGTILVTTPHTTNDILTGTVAGSTTSTWQQSAGMTMAGGWFRMGTVAGAGGIYNVNGGTLSSRGRINIGEANGTAGATATVNVAGGIWNNNNAADLQNITVGGELLGTTAGKGALNLSSGSITNTAAMNIAYGTGGQGTVTVTGGLLTQTGNLVSGRNGGTGVLNVSAGTITNAGELWAGEGANAVGTINLSGSGILNIGSWLAVGRTNGTGTFNMSGGTYNKTANAGAATIVGASGPGTMNQTGGTFNVSAGETWVGETKAGNWNISGGSVNVLVFNVGQNNGGTGILTLQGATGATGPLANGGGTETVTATSLVLGNLNASANGTVNLDGGALVVNTVGRNLGTATFNFNGGTLRARAATTTFVNNLTRANVRNGGAVIDTQANNVTIPQALLHSNVSGDLAADGGLTKSGTGTLALSGANTFTGPLTVNGGRLQAASATSIPAATSVTLGGVLDFNGQYRAGVAAPAALTLANLTASATGELTFNFNNSGADKVAVTNAATVAAGAKLNVTFATGTTLTAGTYTLLSAPSGLDAFTFTGPASVTTGGFFYPLTYSATPTADTVTIGAGQIAKLYYTGGTDNLLSNPANYSTDLAGTTPSGTAPTAITDVVFTATSAAGNFSPTLDTVTAVNSLQFLGTAGNPAAANSINLTGPGTLTISANSNTFAAGTGIVVDAGSAAHTISANLSLATTQIFGNASANIFTVSGDIGGPGGLTKTGTGTTVLGGNNTFAGPLTLNGGILRFDTVASLGNGNPINFTGGTLQFGAGVNTDISTTHAINFNGAGTIGTNGNNVTLAGTFGGTGGGSITKIGAGELTLTGGTAFTGSATNLFVRAGTLTLTGAPEIIATNNYGSIGQNAGDRAILNVLAGAKYTTTGDLNLGDVGGTTLANVDGGIVNLSGAGSAITANSLFIGKGTNATTQFGYGVLNQGAGSTFTNGGNSQIGAFGIGQYNLAGGTWNHTGGFISVGRQTGSFGVIDLNGGTLTDTAAARTIIGEVGTGVLNVRNGGILNSNTSGVTGTGNLLTSNAALTLGNNAGGVGIANLLPGGTISTTSIGGLNASSTGIFNFNGGTLATRSANATFVQNLTSLNVFAGGAFIDTTAGDGTINQALVAPAGAGVDSITATGTGFTSTPIVQITGGGGTGATAVATIDNTGTLTGVTVTNPGTAYTSAPTVTITGAFGTQVTGTATLNAGNVSGALTKLGSGTLTLTRANTYTGATTISAGGLQLGNGTTGNDGTILTATVTNNGTLTYNRFGNFTNATLIVGTGGVTKLGPGTQTLTAANSYTGVTTVGGGILSVADIGNGGANSNIGAATADSANLVFNGNGQLQYTGPALITARGYTVGTGGGIDNANDVTFQGQILATGNGSFTKNGAGTLNYTNVTGTNALTGGNAGNGLGYVVNAGLVNLGGTAGTPLAQTNTINSELIIGTINSATSPAAELDINGGTTTVASFIGVGRGNGTNNAATVLSINNNAVVTSGNFAIAFSNGVAGYTSSPTVNFSGTSSYTDAGVFTVGESVNGAGGISTVNINGSAAVILSTTGANNVNVGASSAAVLNQNGGSLTAGVKLTIARDATSTAAYFLNGGTLTATSVNGGLGTSTLNFNGGTLVAPAASATFVQGLTRANVRNGGAIVDTGAFAVTVPQTLVHSDVGGDAATDGGLTKFGSGTLTLTTASTYTGNTTVSAGTLELQADDSLADLANVNLTSGATLNLNFTGTDTVSRLFIDGAEQPAGLYGSIGSGAANERAYILGTGILDVTNGAAVATPFQTYVAARGLSGPDAAPSADPDADGFNNLAEFVLAGEPNPANGGSNTTGLVPTVSASAGNHIFSFRRNQAATTQPGIAINYEYGSDLTGWTTATDGVDGVTITITPNGYEPGVDRVDVSVPDSLGVNGKVFVRLNATLP